MADPQHPARMAEAVTFRTEDGRAEHYIVEPFPVRLVVGLVLASLAVGVAGGALAAIVGGAV